MTVYSIIPVFGDAISTVIAFVIALSIIVAIHEYGHYIVGRWSGIEADVFSIGFGPVLFSRIDSRGTRWQIAALPLGGYVKFRGDADAASSKDVQALQTQDDTTKKPAILSAWDTLDGAERFVFNKLLKT